MWWNDEADICESYRESYSGTLVAERTVGQELIRKHAPEGIDGARSPQADLTTEEISSENKITLVECKCEFKHRAVGQLLMYDYLLRSDARAKGEPIQSINRELVLGQKPQSVVPTVCQDLAINVLLWASGGWQSITSGVQTIGHTRTPDDEIIQHLAAGSTASLDSPSEEDVLNTPAFNQLPGLHSEHIYREISVGNSVFTGECNNFKTDVIGYAPELSIFYVIEVKEKPDIGGLQKAIGQATNYAMLFRRDWNLPIETVVPGVVINQAPWITDVYRNSRYETEQGMFQNAIANADEPVICMNKVEVYK